MSQTHTDNLNDATALLDHGADCRLLYPAFDLHRLGIQADDRELDLNAIQSSAANGELRCAGRSGFEELKLLMQAYSEP